MIMREFIRTHRDAIDSVINRQRDYVPATASCFCHRNGTDHQHLTLDESD
jgi:hypothetical protein